MIDCHFHTWDINQPYYTWLTPDLGAIYKSYTFDDYHSVTEHKGIEASIVVQAADDINESRMLLEKTAHDPKVQGVIGWVDFESPSALEDLEALCSYSKFKGVRPMLQDIQERDWILDPDFDPLFKFLSSKDLVFEALIRQEHLPNITKLAQKYPELSIVVNHGAKPLIDGDMQSKQCIEWMQGIQMISLEPNVYCKLSGLITECPGDYSYEILEPYMRHLLLSFTAKKLFWGSDWPVLNLKSDYHQWVQISHRFFSTLKPEESRRIKRENAIGFYHLKL